MLTSCHLPSSFSTDDDNDTEVEAIEVDMELNLVTECWVEPQSGYVDSSSDSWQHLHGLSYQKIPKAVCFCGRGSIEDRGHMESSSYKGTHWMTALKARGREPVNMLLGWKAFAYDN